MNAKLEARCTIGFVNFVELYLFCSVYPACLNYIHINGVMSNVHAILLMSKKKLLENFSPQTLPRESSVRDALDIRILIMGFN